MKILLINNSKKKLISLLSNNKNYRMNFLKLKCLYKKYKIKIPSFKSKY